MSIKRLPVLFSVASLFACVFVALNAARFSNVCACGTVNGSVMSGLNELDGIIHQFIINHDGLSPTYTELVELVSSDSQLSQWLSQRLTPKVNFTSRAFTFPITQTDAGTIGYAVSSDRRDYVLLGIGIQIRQMYFFGWEPIPPSYKMQIWRLGEIVPVDEFVIH
jgi:hypothetical protein